VKQQLRDLATYSGMVFQIFALLFAAYLVGNALDQRTGFKHPYFTILLLLLSIFIYLYKVIKDTSNKKK
jgi:ATP synthase protein I